MAPGLLLPLEPAEGQTLLTIAYAALADVAGGIPGARQAPAALSARLRLPQACFVTLKKAGALRGCVGGLKAERALAEAVVHYTGLAALCDPRFEPVSAGEVDQLRIELSLLSSPELMRVGSEAELLAELRPGVDGLLLEEASRQATFLPQVWGMLPQASLFVAHLKDKGGWPPGYWSDRLRCYRYQVQSLSGLPPDSGGGQ